MRRESTKALLFAAAFLAGSVTGPDTAKAGPAFRTVVIPAHSYTGGWEFFVGGGVAVFDCNGDHLPELFAAGGAGPARLFLNATPAPGAPLAFTEHTPEALAITGATGAYPLDLDNDGILDLALLRFGENRLLQGLGECRFAPFPDDLGFTSADRWTTAFSATWETDQRLPTLAFGNYVDRHDPEGPFRACDANMLYRPEGDRYVPPLGLEPGFCALSALFSDWGRRGRADLRLSNDRHYYVEGGSEQLWAMEPTPRLYTEAEGWRPYRLWGMGIASRDLSGDGYADVFLSSMGDQKLQIFDPSTGGPTFLDAPYARGTTAHRPYVGDDGRPSTGWHIAFGDVQNDGLDDVFIAKGNVQEMPGLAMQDPNNLLVQRANGTFAEMGDVAGVASMARARGAAFEDLNLDGRPDLVAVNREAPMEVWENVTAGTGNWLLIDLAQAAPNTRAVGAWIELRAGGRVRAREITVGGGHAGGSATFQHFGLGGADQAEIRVIWPDGAASAWLALPANGIYRITPGETAPGSLRATSLIPR